MHVVITIYKSNTMWSSIPYQELQLFNGMLPHDSHTNKSWKLQTHTLNHPFKSLTNILLAPIHHMCVA